jgi:hypothetical protein
LKTDESLRKEMNNLLPGQLPSMSKAIGSSLPLEKTKVNEMKQTKNK